MSNNTNEQSKEFVELADDARALLEATANVTGQKVEKARKRLELAFERGKSTGEDVADASADMACDTFQKLRDCFTAALAHGRGICETVHDDVVARTKAADHAVRENPYKTLGIALGVGAIVGFIFSSRHPRNGH